VDGAPVTDLADPRPGRGLVDRFWHTWHAPRAAVRDEIDTGSEGRLVFYAMASSFVFTLASVAARALNPTAAVAGSWDAWVTTQVVVGTFFRPLALYGVAGLIGLLCRLAGGGGNHYQTRVAVFWTALVAAPAGFVLTVLGEGATGLAGAPSLVGQLLHGLGSVIWAVLLVPALAEAHGFRRTRGLWLALAGLALASAAVAALV
jgi:hypothetical protein